MITVKEIHVHVAVIIAAIVIVLPLIGLIAEKALARVDLATQEETHHGVR